MKLPAILPVASLFIAALAIAADKADPSGWTDAKWGMTEDQVRTAIPAAKDISKDPLPARTFYKTNATVDDQWVSTVGVDSLDLDGGRWRVFFLFDGPKGLARVILQPIEKTFVSSLEFQSLENIFESKYGHPFRQTDGREFPALHNALWSFPTTTIDLRYADYTSKLPMETLSITYDRRAGNPPI